MSKQETDLPIQKIRFFPNSYWLKKDEKRSHKKMAAPCKRWGHGVVLYENHMYLFGGSGNNTNPRSWEAIYILNCETFEWERVCPSDPFKGNIPEPRDSHSNTRIGNNMYLYGGSNGTAPFNDMFAFNFTFRNWNKIIATGDIPSAREGHSAAALNDRYIFIYGGWNGKSIYNNYYLFDTMTNIWRKVDAEEPASEPAARESHSCCFVKETFYVFGGQGHILRKKENYFNDFYKGKLTFSKNMEKVSCKWEKVIAKNNVSPPHRTSHSMNVYKERYIFLIGGEGYCMESKETRTLESERKDHCSEKDFEDDKTPPCFPKNDVWIYDIDFNYWNLLEARNSELFLPRFTHSCCIFKDQFIIFGGLKDYKNSIDDLIVLVIDDEDYKTEKNKKEIDLCNSCRRLFMVETEAQNKTMPLTNEDLMLEGVREGQIPSQTISYQYEKLTHKKIPKAAQITLEHLSDNRANLERKPFVSIASLRSFALKIQSPFQALGLLFDNAKIKKANNLKITIGEKKAFICLTDDGEVWTLKESHESFLNLKMDPKFFADYEQMDLEEKEKALHEQRKSQYASNFKLGGLRLGETVVYGSKTETSMIIGYMSLSNKKDEPDGEVIFASWGLKTDVRKNEEKRKVLLQRISRFFSEQELCDLIGNNTVLILDIKDELHLNKRNDVFYKPWRLLERKPNFPYKEYLDFSLRKYIGFFWQNPSLKIMLNNEDIPMFSYSEQLEKNQKLFEITPSTELLECTTTRLFKEVSNITLNKESNIIKEQKDSIIKEQNDSIMKDTIINEQNEQKESIINEKNDTLIEIQGSSNKIPESNENEPRPIILNEKEFIIIHEEKPINITNEKANITEEPIIIKEKAIIGVAEIKNQGILFFSEGRLVGRGEDEGFGDFWGFEKRWEKEGGFKIQGVMEVKEFLQMNVVKTDIEMLQVRKVFYYLVKKFLKSERNKKEGEDINWLKRKAEGELEGEEIVKKIQKME